MERFDVLVVGGGVAGVCGAISAARTGLNVALIESSPMVGGIVTEGPLEALMTFHDNQGQIVKGIADEIIVRLIAKGGSPGYISDTVGYCNSLVPYDAELIKLVMYEMLEESKCSLYLNSLVTAVTIQDSKVVSVIINGNSSREELSCLAIIDASGGGEIARLAGASLLYGRESDSKVQPMTTLCKIGNVNTELLRAYVKSNPHHFKLANNADLNTPYLHLWGFKDVLEQGAIEKKLSLNRKELQLMMTPTKGEVVINFSRFVGDPRRIEDVSRAQITTIKQIHQLLNYLKESLEAFKNAQLLHTGKIGIRESRRVKGIYELTPEDILNQRQFEYSVAKGAFPIDIHQPDGQSLTTKSLNGSYCIPMESIISIDIENLFIAGRCISAKHEALASARITATAMATGHAAGVLATIYALHKTVDYGKVKELLASQNAIF
ncbi:MAG: FAD-dependent oxidoreductase [Sphaerochaetaceae bacterium]